jgi:hypothetical protein
VCVCVCMFKSRGTSDSEKEHATRKKEKHSRETIRTAVLEHGFCSSASDQRIVVGQIPKVKVTEEVRVVGVDLL